MSVFLRDTVLVSQKPELDYINFSWNKMTAAEFEGQWKERKTDTKADFIHLIQVVACFYSVSFFGWLCIKNDLLVEFHRCCIM